MDIEEAFASTFRIIFGECNVKLADLEGYLTSCQHPLLRKKSSLSGKQVAVSTDKYASGSKFLSLDEVDFGRKYPSLGMNEIKDLDSIIEAVQDRALYAGNKVFGNSNIVEGSDTVVDSFCVKDSHNVSDCKYMAYCVHARRNCEFCFGASNTFGNKHSIHTGMVMDSARCFETYSSENSSDLFFCMNCMGVSHAMFSFNLRSKRYCIGNLELPKDSYFALRKKLVDESREYIEKNKKFHSILQLGLPKPSLGGIALRPAPPEPKGNPEIVDAAWKGACRVLFGREIGPLTAFEAYLTRNVERVRKVKTVSGKDLIISNVALCYKFMPEDRLVDSSEADQLGRLALEISPDRSLESILGSIGKIAFYRGDHVEGKNVNVVETHWALNTTNSFRTVAPSESKNCAYSTMSLSSESIFGSYRVLRSRFCISCYNSIDLTRCIEVSDSSNCSDSLFCHDSENLRDCMFCFNVKSMQFAIGNVEVGRENYAKAKKLVMEDISRRLEKDKTLMASIYNVGCGGR